jgi:hypothetical protein
MKVTVLDLALFAFRQSSKAATSSAGIEDRTVIISDWFWKGTVKAYNRLDSHNESTNSDLPVQ